MANINDNIGGITDAIRHDIHDLCGKLIMAIAMEDEFINECYSIMNRFYAVDKSSAECRMACYNHSGTEDYYEMSNSIIPDHEKKLKKLRELQTFIGGWERDFK